MGLGRKTCVCMVKTVSPPHTMGRKVKECAHEKKVLPLNSVIKTEYNVDDIAICIRFGNVQKKLKSKHSWN